MIIVVGPTGVGKSDRAIELAHEHDGEIINADMGQLYAPLSIGTAKPDLTHIDIVHHLFGILNQPEQYTVTQYRQAVLATVASIRKRGKTPIIVGGSLFYIDALLFPPLFTNGSTLNLSDNNTNLWHKLYTIDPERAKSIHPHDAYRIKRALYIWQETGRKPSSYRPQFNPPGICQIHYLTRERNELYQRINNRTVAMFKHGLIEEVRSLIGSPWQDFLMKKSIIGYPEVITYLSNTSSMPGAYQNMVDTITKKTRNYAKRQGSFWRMLERKIAQIADMRCTTHIVELSDN